MRQGRANDAHLGSVFREADGRATVQPLPLFRLSDFAPNRTPLRNARYGAIGVVRDLVAHQRAGIRPAIVGNGRAVIFSHHVGIEVHEPLAGDSGRNRSHAVGCMAGGATESILRDVQAVLRETVIGNHVAQVVTLAAHRVGSSDGEIGVGEEVGDEPARRSSLAELIVAFQNVRVHGPVRPIRSGAAKLAVVVAVMAIAAEDAGPGGARGCDSILIELVDEQAGLRQGTRPVVRDGMARGRNGCELGNHIQRVGRRDNSRRRVSIEDQPLFTGAGAVAAQTILILVDRWRQHSDAIQGADAGHARLRGAQRWWSGELRRLVRSVRVVAIDARGVPVVIQQHRFGFVVEVVSRRKRMSRLRHFGHNVRRHRR